MLMDMMGRKGMLSLMCNLFLGWALVLVLRNGLIFLYLASLFDMEGSRQGIILVYTIFLSLYIGGLM